MLTDTEIQRLDELLEAANPEGSMVLEEVDGFFAALACSPEPVPAAEYLPLVTGTDPAGPPPAPELLKLLKRLQAAGLVERSRSADDERQVLVRLTPAGRALDRRAQSIPQRMLARTGCAAAEVLELRRLLVRVRDALDAAAPD